MPKVTDPDLRKIRELNRAIKEAKVAQKAADADSTVIYSKRTSANAICDVETFKPIIRKIITDFNRMQFIFKEEFGIVISRKQLSEYLSTVAAKAIEHFIEDATAPGKDHLSDLLIALRKVEIKAMIGILWRGGELSKRAAYYLLINWTPNGDMFIGGVHLTESDWKVAKVSKKSGRKSYYATSFDLKALAEKLEAGEVDIYHGAVKTYRKGKFRPIKLICHGLEDLA